jgi:hypothetical protein
MGSLLQDNTFAQYARAVMMSELAERRETAPELTLADIFPFTPEQVAAMYLYQNGVEGVWFRLFDGRMFDMHGHLQLATASYT